jgi:DNA repair protein RecN (Recombination protein N)
MNKMGETIQVVAITHLPQVAARGMNHFKVIKSENVENNIKTDIYELDNENRIEEIAGMISGKEITDSALKQAEELLK